MGGRALGESPAGMHDLSVTGLAPQRPTQRGYAICPGFLPAAALTFARCTAGSAEVWGKMVGGTGFEPVTPPV